MSGSSEDTPSAWKRLAWMIGIWAASVAVLAAVAWFIRLLLAPV